MDSTDKRVIHGEEGSFSYKGCSYFYRRWGSPGNPVVVLLHGFMQSSASWNDLACLLQEHYCVYALDFIGHGQSDASLNPERYSYEDMASSVDYFIREVLHVSQVHLVGYSMGGRIALSLIASSCDVLASVVLESCNLGCANEEERTEAAKRNQSWVHRLRCDGMEAFVEYWEDLPLFKTQKELGYHKVLHASRASNNPACMALCLEGAGKQAMPLSGNTLGVLRCVLQGDAGSETSGRRGEVEAVQKNMPQRNMPGDVEGVQNGCHNESGLTEGACSASHKQSRLPLLYLYGSKDEKSKAVANQLSEVGALVSSIDAGHNVHLEAPMLYFKEVQNFLGKVVLDT